jgi:hypothetical protein
MGKKSGSESGMSTRIIFPAIFWIKILKFFDADPEKNRIRDKHPGFATLVIPNYWRLKFLEHVKWMAGRLLWLHGGGSSVIPAHPKVRKPRLHATKIQKNTGILVFRIHQSINIQFNNKKINQTPDF